MLRGFWEYFTDPILRAPTIGCMLMSVAASLIGALFFVRRRSLVGEALSHAAYPGVIFAIYLAVGTFFLPERYVLPMILLGATTTSLLGLFAIDFLERKYRISSDAALCLILSSFFGVGLLAASRLQFSYSLWYKKAQVFFFGQAATMMDAHIYVYATLSFVIVIAVTTLFHSIKAVHFDRDFSVSIGIKIHHIENLLYLLLAVAIVIGIRSVGVVLMSGMLITPAVTARQFTNRLSTMLILSAVFGMISTLLGLIISLELPLWLESSHSWKITLPTGPMILLSATTLAIAALILAPRRGLVSRLIRIYLFKRKCQLENCLKFFWKKGKADTFNVREVAKGEGISYLAGMRSVFRLYLMGFLERKGKGFRLTSDGLKQAAHIVRLHRLWEVYLVDYLGQRPDAVHADAEKMEHILTPEIEKELLKLLKDPAKDPHNQPIPKREGAL